MTRIAWATDLHLEFLNDDEVRRSFAAEVRKSEWDVLLIGGDIGNAGSVCRYLEQILEQVSAPIYFVLGNHDYYNGSVQGVRDKVRELSHKVEGLHWLPDAGIAELTPNTGLIGHGGWGDGRYGDFIQSTVKLNDYIRIKDLTLLSPQERLQKLNELGDDAAAFIRHALPEALTRFSEVIFLTHVPPFREAATHSGEPSDEYYAPHFSCKGTGDAMLEVAEKFPDKKVTVLCGHTHGEGHCQIKPNLEVFTGGAEYYNPKLQRVFERE